MNACKDFHAFTYISMIKTCVTGLVLKDKTQFLILVCKNSEVISIKVD